MNNAGSHSGKRKTVRELIETNKNNPKLSTNFEVLFHKTLREPGILLYKFITIRLFKHVTFKYFCIFIYIKHVLFQDFLKEYRRLCHKE